MSEIFVSHAVADKVLAKALVSFLKEAIGVPTDSIFCSSVPDNGIPLGEDFNGYMKEKIQEPKLVILLMTETYLEREFCLMELGATWAKSHKTLPIVVPPVPFTKVTNTLGLKQSWDITNHAGLVDLKVMIETAMLAANVKLEKRGPHTWDEKRTAWRATLKSVLPNLPRATNVPRSELEKAVADVARKSSEIEDLESQLDAASDRISKLEKLKDAVAVKTLKKSLGEVDAEDEFEALLEAVKSARPEGVSRTVFMHVLLDRFDKSGSIDWMNDREDFERAVQYKVISQDDGYSVLWNTKKLRPLGNAITKLESFLNSEDGRKYMKAQDEDRQFDIDDRAFWEYHL